MNSKKISTLKEYIKKEIKSLIKEDEESILTSRRTPEERLKNWKIATNKMVQQYIKDGSEGDLYLSELPFDIVLPDNLTIGGDLSMRNSKITTLPNNLTVNGKLNISDTEITTLPDSLKVSGDLDISDTKITTFPDSLKVSGTLNIAHTKITTLPDNLELKNLSLSNTKIKFLPDNLKVDGYLDLSDTEITSLPNNLIANGNLMMANTKIQSLPDNLKVNGLDVSNTPISVLPNRLNLTHLDISDTKIQSLPDDLKVSTILYAINTPIQELSKNLLKFKNWKGNQSTLKLDGSQIKTLPAELEVKYLDIENTPLSKKYTEEELRSMLPNVKNLIV